ncbi:MAG: hypothetical protein ACUVTL_10100 [Thermoproteota archaeon]
MRYEQERGTITEEIAKIVRDVLAVQIDPELGATLKEMMSCFKKCEDDH